jgi:integrase/recombinase XerD
MVPVAAESGIKAAGRAMPTPPTNQGKKLPPEPLTRAEVRDLIAAASNRSTSGVRMRALIAVMVGAGLRLAETLDLEPRDVDTGSGTIRVREGKGRKSATVGIDPWAAGHLDRWMDRRPQVGLTGRHRVFAAYEVGKVGQPLDPRYVRLALARLGRRAGIAKRVHPHGLRHSLAFDLAQQGVPMHAIQAQLRHASLAHTDRYVRHLMPTEVITMMRQRTWEEA